MTKFDTRFPEEFSGWSRDRSVYVTLPTTWLRAQASGALEDLARLSHIHACLVLLVCIVSHASTMDRKMHIT